MTTVKPGIYTDISFEEYQQIDAVNQSTLKEIIEKSPLHYQYLLSNPKKETDTMKLGKALDCALFEPEDFGNRFVVHRKFDGRKTIDKEEKQLLIDKWGEGALITEEQKLICDVLNRKSLGEKKVAELLAVKGHNQVTIVWVDEDTGITCKARIDRWTPDLFTLSDLKSTRDAHPYRYVKLMLGLGGHFQAAYYLRGFATLNKTIKHFCHIVFENKAPHALVLREIPEEIIKYGETKVTEALRLLKTCQELREWPSYDNVMPIPGWLNKENAADFIPENIEEF